MKSVLLAAAAFAAIAGSASASVVTFTDRATFLGAAGPVSTETFESCSGGSSATVLSSASPGPCGSIVAGVTFSGPDNYIAGVGQSSNPTIALGVNLPNGGPQTVTFASGASAFGSDLFQNFGGGSQSGSDATFTVNAYGAADALLGTFVFPIASDGGGFFGLTSTSSIFKVTVAQTGGYAVMDNVSFSSAGGVPEPATWAMMIAGFGMAGAALRRRSALAQA